VNRRNLKIINFEHEIGVRKRVLIAMNSSINANNFGSKLKKIVSKRT
jgi:hypothetical protein